MTSTVISGVRKLFGNASVIGYDDRSNRERRPRYRIIIVDRRSDVGIDGKLLRARAHHQTRRPAYVRTTARAASPGERVRIRGQGIHGIRIHPPPRPQEIFVSFCGRGAFSKVRRPFLKFSEFVLHVIFLSLEVFQTTPIYIFRF